MNSDKQLKLIFSDYKYIQDVKRNHIELIKKASNNRWVFKKLVYHPKCDGVCEYGNKDDYRHIGLKMIIKLKNRKDELTISVGSGCYRKIMGSGNFPKLPTMQEWNQSVEDVKKAEIRFKQLIYNLNIFLKNEFPKLVDLAEKYNINFNKDKFLDYLKDPYSIGLVVGRIRNLYELVDKYEAHQQAEIIRKK